MDQGRHAAERMQGEVGRGHIGRERVHLDLLAGDALLGQGQAGDALIDAVPVAMENESHRAILTAR